MAHGVGKDERGLQWVEHRHAPWGPTLMAAWRRHYAGKFPALASSAEALGAAERAAGGAGGVGGAGAGAGAGAAGAAGAAGSEAERRVRALFARARAGADKDAMRRATEQPRLYDNEGWRKLAVDEARLAAFERSFENARAAAARGVGVAELSAIVDRAAVERAKAAAIGHERVLLPYLLTEKYTSYGRHFSELSVSRVSSFIR
jgi:hypothetical protein